MTVLDQRRRGGRVVGLLMVFGLLWGLLAAALPVGAAPGAAAAIPTPVTSGVPRFEGGPCVYDLPKNLVDGQNIVCGYVVVAEQHANPGGKTIKLPVGIIKATGATPAPDPVVLLAGGPGQSGQIFATLADPQIPFYSALTTNRDVIFFDQRGTGKAQPSLICTELLEDPNARIRSRLKQPMIQAFDEEETYTDLVNKCRDRLVGQGVNLSAYTTTENAADVNDVRIALGYGKINIIGASYGSELGLAVARDWGQYIRTNNLVSLVPIEIPWYFQTAQTFDLAIKELARDCGANAACNAANPNLLANFQKVANDLNARPVLLKLKDPDTGKVVVELPLNGDDFVNVMFQFFYTTSLVPFLPDMISRAARGNFVWLENLAILLLFEDGSDPISIGMHYSVVCSKDPSQANLDATLKGDEGLLPEVRRALQPSSKEYYQICQTWPSKNADPKGAAPAKSDVPTTLVSGQFDPITPPKYADIARASLTKATSVTLPGGGHSAIVPTTPVGACGLAVMVSLINTGTTADTSCAARLQTNYRVLPSVYSGDPAPSATPRPSASGSPIPTATVTPTPAPRPSAPPSALPSPPSTGNGGYPGLPNTGSGAAAGGVAADSRGWWLILPALLAAPLAYGLRRRFRRP